jgi:S1-C subfamily serine protease
MFPNPKRCLAGILMIGIPAALYGVPPAAPPAPAPAVSAAEQNLISIFKRVSPSVVSVANKTVMLDFYDRQLYEVPQGAGSGIIWDKEGHLISNFHVVYGASAIQVTLHNGESYPAEVVGVDSDGDIAVLRIKAPPALLVPIVPGRSATLQVGQTALAIGNPFGLDTSLSVGVVSALGRTITSMSDRQIRNVIQTDAAINPGNSGGALLDSSGRLIGMNTAIISPSGAYAGVGFAVPVDTICRAVPQLIQTGKVTRPTLGIRMVPNHILRPSQKKGVAILSVTPNSPAGQAGLKGLRQTRAGEVIFGDILLEMDGTAVNSPDDVAAIIDGHQAGDEVRLVVQRGESSRTVTAILRSE